jgi:hypothetical protein
MFAGTVVPQCVQAWVVDCAIVFSFSLLAKDGDRAGLGKLE